MDLHQCPVTGSGAAPVHALVVRWDGEDAENTAGLA